MNKKQLFSYMRQLKLEHGLLIGNKIQIYYDGKVNTIEDPILLKSLDISGSNREGLSFITLFQKESFSYSQLEKFAEKTVKELATERHKKKLRNLLLSHEYKSKIQQFIVDDLQQNWDRETMKNILSQLSISISLKSLSSSTFPAPLTVYSTENLNCKLAIKKKSPPTHPWIQEVPELRHVSGLKTWTDICKHLGVKVGGDSGRRAIQRWVKDNKPSWPNVP